jgi:hypothetical protein
MSIVYGNAVSLNETAQPKSRLPDAERRGRPKFVAMVHPDRWVYDTHAKAFLPEVGKMLISAGVNGVRLIGNREEDTLARANYGRKGWILIENGDPRLNPSPKNGQYLASWDTRSNFKVYGFHYEGFELVGSQVDWGVDHDARVAFLKQIVSAGIVPPMNPKLAQREIRQVELRVRRMEDRLAQNPNLANTSLVSRLSDAKKLLADMKASLTPQGKVKAKEE